MYKFSIDDTNPKYGVYINLISSPAGSYLSRRPYIFGLIKEVLETCKLNGQRVVVEHDMGRDIGTTDVVLTSSSDNIYYAQPIKSNVFSRFAKNRRPQVSSTLTVVFERDNLGNYEVTDTWIGINHPAFPGDKSATSASKKFWQNHALVQDAQLIQARTLTKVCPY